MNRLLSVWAALAASTLLNGCGAISDEISSTTTTAGPKPLIIPYEDLSLPALLDPDGKVKAADPAAWETATDGQRIDLAFNAFHTLYPPTTERERRDQVQERLLGISNQLCSRYQSYIQNIHSDGNFILGSLATIAGAAGAIFTGGASQILAGTAGALSGVRAEFNQDYFSNLTIAVITSGINLRRQEIYDEIVRFGSERSEKRYTVEAAVKDALFYHGECSLMAGVEKAGAAIKLAQDPGLDAATRTLVKVNQMRKIAQEQVTDPTVVPGLGVNTTKLLQAGKPVGDFEEDGGSLPSLMLGRLKLQVAALSQKAVEGLGAITTFEKPKETRDDIKGAIDATTTAVVAAIETCRPKADVATNAAVKALSDQAGAADETARTVAQRKLEAALLEGNAVVAKARTQADVFDQKLAQAAAQLANAEALAKSQGKDAKIAADVIATAKKTIEEAKTDVTSCSG